MLKYLLGLACAFSFATVGLAENYHCEFAPTGNSATSPRSVDFSYEAGAETAKVRDPVILKNYGDFILAEVKTDSANRLRLQWTLHAVKTAGDNLNWSRTATVVYALSRSKSDGSTRLRVARSFPPGLYDEDIAGRCTVVKK